MPRVFKDNQRVKVVKAPDEAPHLLGMVGVIAYAWRTTIRVHVNDAFTDLKVGDVEPLDKK